VTTFPEAIYKKVDAGTGSTPVSPELRRHGDSTPAVIYEISQLAFDIEMNGALTGVGSATVRLDCIADSVADAWSLALDVVAAIDGKWTQGTIDVVLTSCNITQTRATPDDGQDDAERIATVTAEFQFEET
jgi:hypothetical protein